MSCLRTRSSLARRGASILLLSIAAACSSATGPERDLDVRLDLGRADLALGDTVTVELIVTNLTGRSQVFRAGCGVFSLEVAKSPDLIGHAGSPTTCSAARTGRELAPGEQLSYSMSFDGHAWVSQPAGSSSSQLWLQLPPGAYRMTGITEDFRTESVEFSIVPAGS